MKKIINTPETLVNEMCRGAALANPDISLIPKYKVLHRRKLNRRKVSLISGGGSGHEPAHAGFVGKGMLDAAVCGDIFASPSQIQVYQAIRAVAGERGVLLIIKNYSGDIMNFRNGAALAQEEGIKVEYIKVDDDAAVKDSTYTVGRRGVAGTILVHKVAGAAAEMGLELEEVKKAAQEAADHVRSIGAAFTSCTVPAKGTPTFTLGEDEMEYGVGIHGEPGRSREKILSADELAERMTALLKEDMDLEEGSEITLLINGFGSTPLQELEVLNHSVRKCLEKKKITVYRTFVGNYMTSIDMAGASVSFMEMNDNLRNFIDQPSNAPAFRVDGKVDKTEYCPPYSPAGDECRDITVESSWLSINDNVLTKENMKALILEMSRSIIKNEVAFCELDAFAGDGDFGMSIAKGFRQLMREWDEVCSEGNGSIGAFLKACSMVIMENCGGASGPIWGSAFRAAGVEAGELKEINLCQFAEVMQAAVRGIQATGERSFGRGAVVGDKTLIDALIPCADALTKAAWTDLTLTEAMRRGAEAAVKGAEATSEIAARMGRAGVVGARSLGHPDAGAHALGVIFTDICNAFFA